MSAPNTFQFVGKGKLYLKEPGSSDDNYRDAGNVMELKVIPSETVKEQKNMRTAGGGLAASYRRIEKAELSIVFGEHSPENMEIAASGTASDGTSAETYSIGTSPAAAAIAAAAAATVAAGLTSGADATALTAAALALTAAAIGALPGTTTAAASDATDAAAATAGAPATALTAAAAALTAAAAATTVVPGSPQSVIELFTVGSKVWAVKFVGLNEMSDGSPVIAYFYKARFGPTSSLDFLSDDIATLPVKATLERDETVTGAGVSKYGRVEVVLPE